LPLPGDPADVDMTDAADSLDVRRLSAISGAGVPLTADSAALIIALFLPQFHSIEENDKWWGDGFTEWTNVQRGRPWFDGHDQPKVPTELGYYDLRDLDVHYAQAALARAYGVGAFCYYAYWFAGRRLLETPLKLIAQNPDLAMPYAICWANEPWSRRWDGSEDEVLMPQSHSPERDAGFIDDIAEHLGDSRYIRVGGRPLILVYRAGLLEEPLRTTDALRDRSIRLGLGEPHLAMVQSWGHWEPLGYGFDSAVEFGPIGVRSRPASVRPYRGFHGSLLSYPDVIRTHLGRPAPSFPWYRIVAPGWDNTARRGASGTVFVGATPDRFRKWLEEVLRFTYLFRPPGERMLFINAWNEWGEGAFLEPDRANGDAMLGAVMTALASTRRYADETAALMRLEPGSDGLLEESRARWRYKRISDPSAAYE
jgi:lipopolysaccharide biosynthesis protein